MRHCTFGAMALTCFSLTLVPVVSRPLARLGLERARLLSPSKPTKFPLPYIYSGKKGANPGNGTGTGLTADTHCPTKRAISYADFLLPQAIDNATTQPINVQPRNTFTTMTLPLFGIDL